MGLPRSTTLFHFTKSLEILKSILKAGAFFPRYSLEDIEWLGTSVDSVAFPVVCFCDIPLGRIIDHVKFYGQYGIGMKQDWGITSGLNPVTYVSENSHFADILKHCWMASDIAMKAENNPSHMKNARRLIGYCKPLSGQMNVQGKDTKKTFYHESEWRFLASHTHISEYLKKDAFSDQTERQDANSLSEKYCPLSFSLQDIKYLFVKSEVDIPDLVNFINSELALNPLKDVQMLNSRIISQDTIENDI